MDKRDNTSPSGRLARRLLVIGMLLLIVYVSGYFSLSETILGGYGMKIRVFNARWQADVFQPAGAIESRLTPYTVHVTSEDRVIGGDR